MLIEMRLVCKIILIPGIWLKCFPFFQHVGIRCFISPMRRDCWCKFFFRNTTTLTSWWCRHHCLAVIFRRIFSLHSNKIHIENLWWKTKTLFILIYHYLCWRLLVSISDTTVWLLTDCTWCNFHVWKCYKTFVVLTHLSMAWVSRDFTVQSYKNFTRGSLVCNCQTDLSSLSLTNLAI